MRIKKHYNLLALLTLIIGLGLACDSGQLAEANKLVDEANASIQKSNDGEKKISPLFNELLGDKLKSVEDIEAHKTDNKAKFDELVKLAEQAEKDANDAGGKFEQVSNMKVEDKFKEYAKLKGQEFKKRGEIHKLRATLAKSFLAEADTDKLTKLIEDFNKNSGDAIKQATDLATKSEQIVKDNPSLFGK